jgi:hypothetical protein
MRYIVLALGTGMALLLTSCSSNGSAEPSMIPTYPASVTLAPRIPTAATFDLIGLLTLYWQHKKDNCTGIGGYGDIGPGTAITVLDDTSKVIALGKLGIAGFREIIPAAGDLDAVGSCIYRVVVADVPVGAVFYQVVFAKRAASTISTSDARAGKFDLDMGSAGAQLPLGAAHQDRMKRHPPQT